MAKRVSSSFFGFVEGEGGRAGRSALTFNLTCRGADDLRLSNTT